MAKKLQNFLGHKEKIIWDSSKPDGAPRKLLDITKIKKFGWQPQIGLEEGIKATYEWFLKNTAKEKQMSQKVALIDLTAKSPNYHF